MPKKNKTSQNRQKLTGDKKTIKEEIIQNLLNGDLDKNSLREILIQLATRSLKNSNTFGSTKLIVNSVEPGKVDEKLKKADNKIAKSLGTDDTLSKDDNTERIELDDLDDVDLETIKKLEKKGVRIIYPNLKYRKPKYKNVESILNYVETEGGSGEKIKLVIMNFND
ncbi:MAG: hypothetical protein ABIG60_05925 [Patescibacteria group bacterium]